MKEFRTISIEELKQNTKPDYVSEGFIIYNNIAKEKEFLRQQVELQQIYVTGTFSFSLCRRGTTEFMIGDQKYRIKKNHLIIVLPKQLVGFSQTSPDYEAGLFQGKIQGNNPPVPDNEIPTDNRAERGRGQPVGMVSTATIQENR